MKTYKHYLARSIYAPHLYAAIESQTIVGWINHEIGEMIRDAMKRWEHENLY